MSHLFNIFGIAIPLVICIGVAFSFFVIGAFVGRHKAYASGHKNGKEQGYEQGFSEGRREGVKQGYQDGVDTACESIIQFSNDYRKRPEEI